MVLFRKIFSEVVLLAPHRPCVGGRMTDELCELVTKQGLPTGLVPVEAMSSRLCPSRAPRSHTFRRHGVGGEEGYFVRVA
jgi:hypothetical protein